MGDRGGASAAKRSQPSSREATPRELPRTAPPPSGAEMSDIEEEAPEVEAPAPNEPMDLMTALQQVLKKALAHNSLARGLHEGCKAIERGDAQLTVLAEDCNNADYKKLVEALCREHNIDLIQVPKNTQLGDWAGLCKIDAEGNPKKVVKCSMAVVKDYGEDSEGLTILMEHLKNK